MIIEDKREERKEEYEYHFDNEGHYVCNNDDMGLRVTISHSVAPELDALMQIKNYINTKDSEIQFQLWQNHLELYNIDVD
jgi:hypothetical protein